jgi:class 3 adenylate cyclase/protein-S-isoprenylcysteine O-methyltransferase Ste14
VDPDTVERRLVAILSADVAGYSRLMASDEVATVRALQAAREHIAVFIRQHRGRMVDSPGDNLLAEFPSALDATRCAIEVQRVLRARNADVLPERRLEFRIGLHLGDVMIEGDRIYGEGINIAARLENLSDPGGVCVSGPVWEQVRHKLAIAAKDLGEQTVKNIPDPVRVYRIRLQSGEDADAGVDAGKLAAPPWAGRPDVAVLVVPAAWVFYVAIVFEILFMISPFGLYYYAAYGPSLNLLHRSSWTAWLTDFVLPHFSYTSSRLLDALSDLGLPLVLLGIVLFVVSFAQVYWAKVRGRGLITGGLYALARHPQYLGLAIIGIGAFVAWPRVLVLIMYVTMLFLYGLLARWEEARCLEKFVGAYRAYRRRTGMFLPWPLPRLIPWPAVGPRRTLATLALYVVVVGATVGLGYGLRDYALSHLSAYYAGDMAVLSPARLTDAELRAAMHVATSAADVRQRIESARRGGQLLVYVLPEAWRIADLPLDPASAERQPETDRGHYVPLDFDRFRYRVLVTRARSHDPGARGEAIVKKAYGRDPIVVIRVNTQKAEITGIDTPPPHVHWGDISTPLF